MGQKVGIFVGEKGNWSFFDHIFNDLNAHYETKVFKVKTYNTPLLHGRLNRWAYQNGIRAILKSVDIAFFEWASELLVPASHMPKYCPIVTRLHSFEINVWAPKVNWQNVDRIILVSEEMKRKFCAQYPDHAHKTSVVFNGVALDKFKPPETREFEFNLGMLNSIHPIKRIYEVILIVHILKLKGHNPHLHIAGGRWPDGYFDDYYSATKRLVEKLDLQDDVTFHGNVTDTASWLRKIDIYVSNSYWEGQQVALLEALASGCFCLAHFWDGVEEVLPPENIYITEAELMEKIIHYSHLSAVEQQRLQAQMRHIACQMFDDKQQKVVIRHLLAETLSTL